MPAVYPGAVATTTLFPTKSDGDYVLADHVNLLQLEVMSIETVLGVNPVGASETVASRLSGIASSITTLNSHKDASSQVHGLGLTDGAVVGAAAAQTLTNKTLGAGNSISVGSTLTNSGTISGGTVNATALRQGGTAVILEGDTRLSDTRTPGTNSITTAMIQDLQVTNAKLAGSIGTDKVTGLSTALSDSATHLGSNAGVHGVGTGVRVVGESTTQTLTNKTISGSSNTLSNIPNSALTNSSITINNTQVALGGSISVAGSGGALTAGSVTDNEVSTTANIAQSKIAGLSGIASASTAHIAASANVHGLGVGVAVVGDSATQTLTNKTISGSSNTLSNIPNAALVGSGSITINGTPVALGGSITIATGGITSVTDSVVAAGANIAQSKIANLTTDISNSTAHIAASAGVHGLAAGVAVVGLSTTQELTNKTLGSGTSIKTGTTLTNSGTISGGTVNATTLQQGGTAVVLDGDARLLGTGNVNTSNIADWVSGSTPATGVTTAKLADNAVSQAKIAGGAVNPSKFDSTVYSTTTPANLAPTGAAGNVSALARADHVHSTAGLAVTTGANTFTGTQTFSGSVVASTDVQLPATGYTTQTITNAAGVLKVNGYKIWHEANDGNGSGLDADSIKGKDFIVSTTTPSATGRVAGDVWIQY